MAGREPEWLSRPPHMDMRQNLRAYIQNSFLDHICRKRISIGSRSRSKYTEAWSEGLVCETRKKNIPL